MTNVPPRSTQDADAALAAVAPEDLRERVAARGQWYHTIKLAPGVETPGYFDLRPVAPNVLPRILAGQRCLDVATFDGFWALEMEARGAREVVAIDVLDPSGWDWPAGSAAEVVAAISARKGEGEGFNIVMDALGHDIERHDLSVYDLTPADIGMFDFVYVGSLLLHLRDPVRALERVREVCSGEMVLVDNYDRLLSWLHPRMPIAGLDGQGRPWWWRPNRAGLVRMVRSAGFDVVDRPKRIMLPPGPGHPRPPVNMSTLRNRGSRVELHNALRGDPHLVIRARPRQPSQRLHA
jgi:tRNA (mo5U34)-methyltransferase